MVPLSDVLQHGDPDRQPRRWLTKRWTIVVVIGVLLGGGGLAIARWAGTGGDAPQTLPSVFPTPSALEAGGTTGTRLIGSVPIPAGDQVQLALVPGGIWLSSWVTGTLTRVVVDPKPRVTTRVRIGKPDESVLSMVYGGGVLWAVDSATNSVLALDPATGRVKRRLPLRRWGVADTVAFGAHSLWVACSGQIGNPQVRERVLRVDPTTRRVVGGTTALPGEGENLVVVADGSDVWVGGATPLAHIRASSQTAIISHSEATPPMAVNGATLWTGSPSGLTARDVKTGRVLVDTDLQGTPPMLAVDPYGRAWTLSPSADLGVDMIRPTGFVYRFAQSGKAGRVDALAVDNAALWIYTGKRIIVFDISHMTIN